MELITVALAGLVIILLFIYSQSKDPLSAIPGPFRLPIFGNIQFNFPKLHRQFTEFASRYGDVYRIQILSQPCIVINSYEAMREAYQKRGKDFIGRPHMLRFERMYATNGIAFRGGSEKQKALRQQGIKALKLQSLEHLSNVINDNLDDLVHMINAHQGQAFNPKVTIKKCLINVILSMIFGDKVPFNDPVLDKVMEFNAIAVEAATIGKEDIDVWTWTKPVNPNYKLCEKGREIFNRNIVPIYQRYRDTYEIGRERGVIDQYISQVIAGHLDEEDVYGLLTDYFVGGVETTATALYGFLLILLNNPKIQQRCQSEVDEVIGNNRHARLSDRPSMPYSEACIYELLRYQSVLPILVPRKTVVDTQLCGYKIPRDTWVYTNTWAIHHNEEIYPDAHTYKPERFLDVAGNLIPQDNQARKSIVSFGMGGRSCIGEFLAKNRLFLSLCTLMQNFTFEIDENNPPPCDDARYYKLKIVFDIDDYMLKARQRV